MPKSLSALMYTLNFIVAEVNNIPPVYERALYTTVCARLAVFKTPPVHV